MKKYSQREAPRTGTSIADWAERINREQKIYDKWYESYGHLYFDQRAVRESEPAVASRPAVKIPRPQPVVYLSHCIAEQRRQEEEAANAEKSHSPAGYRHLRKTWDYRATCEQFCDKVKQQDYSAVCHKLKPCSSAPGQVCLPQQNAHRIRDPNGTVHTTKKDTNRQGSSKWRKYSELSKPVHKTESRPVFKLGGEDWVPLTAQDCADLEEIAPSLHSSTWGEQQLPVNDQLDDKSSMVCDDLNSYSSKRNSKSAAACSIQAKLKSVLFPSPLRDAVTQSREFRGQRHTDFVNFLNSSVPCNVKPSQRFGGKAHVQGNDASSSLVPWTVHLDQKTTLDVSKTPLRR